MNDPTKQLAQWNQSAYEAALTYARAGLESVEQLLRLNLETARQTLETQTRNTRELLSARDPQTALSKLAEANMHQTAAYASSVYEIVSQMQNQLRSTFEEQLARVNTAMKGGAADIARSVPGGEISSAALKSTLAATDAMMESITQATRQFGSLSEETLKATAQHMVKGAEELTKVAESPKKR